MANIPIMQHTDIEWVFTIPNGASVSNGVKISNIAPRGLQVLLPAAWTAADVAIEVSDNNSDYYPLRVYDQTKVKLTNVPTSSSPLSSCVFKGEGWAIGSWKWIRLASVNTAAQDTYVNQIGADRTFIGKPMS